MSLPLLILWGARINTRQKIGLVVVFSLSFLVIAGAIIRAIEIVGKAYSDQAALAVWGIAESTICKSPMSLLPTPRRWSEARRWD